MRQPAAQHGEEQRRWAVVPPRAENSPLVTLLVGLVVLFGLLVHPLFIVPPERSSSSENVQTSARLACRFPSEHETLLVYINTRPDGSIAVQCGPAVSGPRRR
jgi:hypothetical protein